MPELQVESEPVAPSVDAIYEFIRTLFNKACLSSECSLVCLIYVERLMEAASVPLLASTWKPVVLCGLLLASKVCALLYNEQITHILSHSSFCSDASLWQIAAVVSLLYVVSSFASCSLYVKKTVRAAHLTVVLL
jgi:Cyclin, N-terminal domain